MATVAQTMAMTTVVRMMVMITMTQTLKMKPNWISRKFVPFSLTVTIDNDIEASSRKVFNQPDLDIDILIVPVNDTAAYNY